MRQSKQRTKLPMSDSQDLRGRRFAFGSIWPKRGHCVDPVIDKMRWRFHLVTLSQQQSIGGGRGCGCDRLGDAITAGQAVAHFGDRAADGRNPQQQ